MPRRALSVCPVPGCPELSPSGKCDEHRRAADRARGSGAARGWSKRWAAFRLRYLRDHPMCECGPDCCPEGCDQPATDVDHIDGTGRNGPRAYDPTNLQALSHACHSRKTARQDGAFGR